MMKDIPADWLLNDISDDHYGLWEVEWAMNSKGIIADRQFRIDIVAELVRRGMIDVSVGRLGAENAPVNCDDAINLLSNEQSWLPRCTPDEPVVVITTSKYGDDYLNNSK